MNEQAEVAPDLVEDAAPERADESPLDVLVQHQEKASIDIPKVRMAKSNPLPDKLFSGLTTGAGWFIVVLIALIAVFLVTTAWTPLRHDSVNFLTSSRWEVSDTALAFGIKSVLWTTVLAALLAMLLAVPVAIGVALLITHYTNPKVGRVIGFLVDLLAAVPSVVYGLWGTKIFAPWLKPAGDAISGSPLADIPWAGRLFRPDIADPGTVFAASLVLGIMILPIVTAITRDVFDQTPREHIEAAWALGATKWEMIKTAVIPYGRSGTVAAAMLGLGRALGETIAVMLILTGVTKFNPSLFSGGETFASKIASAAPEFDSQRKAGAYIAAGLVLFLLTFAVNAIARVVAGGKKG